MAKILYSLIAGDDTPLIEANLGASSNKYVRACRKILKKIARNELRRPDGMATLLSGSFAYNYIHGSDPDENMPVLENLVFLCVTESLPYSATPSETREAAFHFLSEIRSKFLEQFRGDLAVLFKATNQSHNLSDTASIDSSSIISIDPKMKGDLRIFSAHMKDQMSVNMDEKDSDTDTFQNIYDKTGDEDEKNAEYGRFDSHHGRNNKKVNGYTDLRRDPPQSGSSLYSTTNSSKFDQIIVGIESVKEKARDGIEAALERRENIALLQHKSEALSEGATDFHNRSRTVRYRFCRDLLKQRCIIAIVVIFVIYLLSAMICGWRWQSCG